MNKRLLIFFFFLLLSIIIWFLTALNRNYDTVLSYPVRYIRYPEDKVLINDVPDRLDLNVNARGFTLLRYKLKSRLLPIIFDVNSFSLNSLTDREPYIVYILSDFAIEKIQQQLSDDITISSISPDSLIFHFADMKLKVLPIRVAIDIEYEKQFMQVGKIILNPDSVTVSGPGNVIDTLSWIETQAQKFTGVNGDQELLLPLQPVPLTEYSINEIQVFIPVEKFTEETLEVPIEVLNVPDSLFLRTFPGSIVVTYQVGLSDYENVNPHMFRAIVDYNTIESSISRRLQVSLVRSPEYVQATHFYPKNVEYIIEK